jgi:hypothetical protein
MRKRYKIIKCIVRVFRAWCNLHKGNKNYTHTHHVINLSKDKHGNYEFTIQLMGKNHTENILPEIILPDDNLVSRFSPLDIRTLTYLGHLGISSPQYKILAKKPSENFDQTLF